MMKMEPEGMRDVVVGSLETDRSEKNPVAGGGG